MKPTIELKTFDELAQYRRRIQTPASAGKQSGKKKITPAYILKNPLAPAAAFIGVAAAIFCIVSDMGFLPVYGAVCIALFGVMCAFMPAGRSFVYSLVLFALYPVIEIIIARVRTGAMPYEDKMFLVEYVPLIVILVVLYIVSLKLKDKIRSRPVQSVFKTDDGWKFIDMLLADVKPMQSYPRLAHAVCRIDPPQQVKTLSNSRSGVAKFAYSSKLLLCASKLRNAPSQVMEHFIYVPRDYDVSGLNKYFDKHFKDYDISVSEDPDWDVFRHDILPSDEELQNIYNERMCELMTRRGMDLEQVRRICYVTCFSDADSAMRAAEAAKENGFSIYSSNNQQISRQTAEDGSTVYVTALELESSTGLQKLNANSAKVMAFVREYGGYLHHWTLIRDGRGRRG